MGRGITPRKIGEVPRSLADWEPTEIFEMLDPQGCHAAIREPIDEESPRCFIGGGKFNVEAAAHLFAYSGTKIVTFAYGCTRTPDLRAANAPFEGEVMALAFQSSVLRNYEEDTLENADLLAWTKQEEELCNSELELRHIFDLALERNLRNIAIITVTAHQARVQLLADRLRDTDVKYVYAHTFSSESILLHEDPLLADEIMREFISPAFIRTAQREKIGVDKLCHPEIHGEYGAAKPPIA